MINNNKNNNVKVNKNSPYNFDENEDLIKEIQKLAETIINRDLKRKNFNFNDLKTNLINELVPVLANKTGRVPIILPIILDIKNNNKIKT